MLNSLPLLKMNKSPRVWSNPQTAIFGGLLLVVAGMSGYWFSTSRHLVVEEEAAPIISVQDILNTHDFMDAALTYHQQGDVEPLTAVFAAAQALAQEAGLDEQALVYLRSSEAREYVLFRAKREQFWREVERHYRELLPMAPLHARFPEASDLFAKADALEQSREQTLAAIAAVLAAPEEPTAIHHAKAERLWQERHVSLDSPSH